MGFDAAQIEGATRSQLLPINILQHALPVLHATMLDIEHVVRIIETWSV